MLLIILAYLYQKVNPTIKFPGPCKRPIAVKICQFFSSEREFGSAEINFFIPNINPKHIKETAHE